MQPFINKMKGGDIMCSECGCEIENIEEEEGRDYNKEREEEDDS